MSHSIHPTVQPDDLFRLQLVIDGQLSPDGRTVAYEVKRHDPQTRAEMSAIFLLESCDFVRFQT